MLLRARAVLPVARPVLENAAILIQDGRIAAVDRWPALAAEARGDVLDLGDAAILPGLVNAHCHLDYTHLAGLIPPLKHFTDWIKSIVALKADWSYTEFAASWIDGAAMLLQSGTTTVADMEAVPELLPDAWQATPLRVLSFRELIHLKPRPTADELVHAASRQFDAMPDARGRFGLAPHAPYTTSGELLRLAGRLARRNRWPLAIHAAESEDEFLMFMYRHGPLFDWLKHQRDMHDCGQGSPLAHLERCGLLGPDLLAVHVNHLGRDDIPRLVRHGTSVVHCPTSHAYFQHLQFPRAPLAHAGVNICLGTDSLASAPKFGAAPPQLDMFEEMRLLARRAPELSPAHILRMATCNGAAALGLSGQIGELAPNALADLIVVPLTDPQADPGESVLHHSGPVRASMIGGRWVLPPPETAPPKRTR